MLSSLAVLFFVYRYHFSSSVFSSVVIVIKVQAGGSMWVLS